MRVEYTTVMPSDDFQEKTRETYRNQPEKAESIIDHSKHYRVNGLLSEYSCCGDMLEAIYDYCIVFESVCRIGLVFAESPGISLNFCPFCGSRIECLETKRSRSVSRVVEKVVLETVYEEIEEEVANQS